MFSLPCLFLSVLSCFYPEISHLFWLLKLHHCHCTCSRLPEPSQGLLDFVLHLQPTSISHDTTCQICEARQLKASLSFQSGEKIPVEDLQTIAFLPQTSFTLTPPSTCSFILSLIESGDKRSCMDSVKTIRIRNGNVGFQSFWINSSVAYSSNLIKFIHLVSTARSHPFLSQSLSISRLKGIVVVSPPCQFESATVWIPVSRPLLFTGASRRVDHLSFLTVDILPLWSIIQRRCLSTSPTGVVLICLWLGQTHIFEGPIDTFESIIMALVA